MSKHNILTNPICIGTNNLLQIERLIGYKMKIWLQKQEQGDTQQQQQQ